jgi:hypothetical protein
MTRFALLLLAGCATTTFAFSPTVTVVTSKPDNCKIEVMTSLPSRSYQEIGTLELYNGPEPKTLPEFHDAVAKQACGAGGDAVVAEADNKGRFTKGTVIAFMGPDVPARPGAAPEQQGDSELPK